jgi:hypothetical protein
MHWHRVSGQEPLLNMHTGWPCWETFSLKDDDLAGRMGLQIKELNKLMAVLSNDRLVHVYVQRYLFILALPL